MAIILNYEGLPIALLLKKKAVIQSIGNITIKEGGKMETGEDIFRE